MKLRIDVILGFHKVNKSIKGSLTIPLYCWLSFDICVYPEETAVVFLFPTTAHQEQKANLSNHWVGLDKE